eukprot:scaffold1954_cov268-Pinguiococcus_pyrenoidosus.AAC.146
MRQFSARIWYICRLVTSVQRPWRMMSTQPRMLGMRDVKGAAMLASPSFTIGSAPSSRSSICAASFEALRPTDRPPAAVSPAPPGSLASASPSAPAGASELRPCAAPASAWPRDAGTRRFPVGTPRPERRAPHARPSERRRGRAG